METAVIIGRIVFDCGHDRTNEALGSAIGIMTNEQRRQLINILSKDHAEH